MKLNQLRKEVDKLDKKILSFLNERTKLILKIGKLKREKGIGIYAPTREKEVYQTLTKKNKGPLPTESVRAIYREIMSGALSLEKDLKVAYLGPQFTFTHIASLRKFGSSVRYIPCDSITDVFTEVARSRCDYGVVPIENSVEGAVNHTLDMFIDSDVNIFSEVYLEISHNLLGRASKKSSKIDKVYSNPQVFGQCRLWLKANLPKAKLIEVSSTAKAADIVSKQKNAACIASSLSAKKYKLNILASSIEDSSHNVTRFLIIGKQILPKPTGDDKTSIMFSMKDKVGALHDILMPFKKNKINLTKIESRPSKLKAWKYYFFVDLEGHCKSKKVMTALSQLRKECRYLKILGSYPKGE